MLKNESLSVCFGLHNEVDLCYTNDIAGNTSCSIQYSCLLIFIEAFAAKVAVMIKRLVEGCQHMTSSHYLAIIHYTRL